MKEEAKSFISTLINKDKIAGAVKSAKRWQKQADSVSEESTGAELSSANIDWGITQGFLNCLRQLDCIEPVDYENLQKKQRIIRARLESLQEKRTRQSANLHESV